MTHSSLTSIQRGADFILHFRNRPFTLQDIADRYQISYKAAQKFREKVELLVNIEAAGFQEPPDNYRGGPLKWLWRLKI